MFFWTVIFVVVRKKIKRKEKTQGTDNDNLIMKKNKFLIKKLEKI